MQRIIYLYLYLQLKCEIYNFVVIILSLYEFYKKDLNIRADIYLTLKATTDILNPSFIFVPFY